jgi:hypothetical protein
LILSREKQFAERTGQIGGKLFVSNLVTPFSGLIRIEKCKGFRISAGLFRKRKQWL